VCAAGVPALVRADWKRGRALWRRGGGWRLRPPRQPPRPFPHHLRCNHRRQNLRMRLQSAHQSWITGTNWQLHYYPPHTLLINGYIHLLPTSYGYIHTYLFTTGIDMGTGDGYPPALAFRVLNKQRYLLPIQLFCGGSICHH